MGTDIHFFAERRVRETAAWQRVLPPEGYVDPGLAWLLEKENSEYWEKRVPFSWYSGRNYTLFGALANVRNGSGFAGVRTGDPIPPISHPRGLPNDLSADVQAIADESVDSDEAYDRGDSAWLGDHSFSWLTLRELQEYDWDRGKLVAGIVPFAEFRARVEEHGRNVPLHTDTAPYSGWSGGISGPGITVMDATEALSALKNGGVVESPTQRPHVRDEWVHSLRVSVAGFVDTVIPGLALVGSPDNVRVVFGFDS